MRLVFLVDQVYKHGGIERVLSIKANYFASFEENDIFILTTEQKNNDKCYAFNDTIIFKDLAVNYKRSKSYFHPINLIKLPSHIFKLRTTLKSINPDIVIVCSHSTDTFFIPYINRAIPKIKEFHFSKFIEEHVRKSDKFSFKKLFLNFADYVEKKYDSIVVLNKDEASYYNSQNVEIIPNPVTFMPDSVSKLDSKKAIAVGRIGQVKGFEFLIDIWKIVAVSYPDWELHIYGEGTEDYVRDLSDKIKSYKLNNHILLKGATNDVKEKMIESSLFLMTSLNECFPLVLLEAQACGLPIISFDCPHGPRNIVNESNGILIDQNDTIAFADAIISLIKNDTKRHDLGVNSRINSLNYTVESIMPLWQNLFNKLIANKH